MKDDGKMTKDDWTITRMTKMTNDDYKMTWKWKKWLK